MIRLLKCNDFPPFDKHIGLSTYETLDPETYSYSGRHSFERDETQCSLTFAEEFLSFATFGGGRREKMMTKFLGMG